MRISIPSPVGAQEAQNAWGQFSSSYLFRHTAALYVAVVVCAFAEDAGCVSSWLWRRTRASASALLARRVGKLRVSMSCRFVREESEGRWGQDAELGGWGLLHCFRDHLGKPTVAAPHTTPSQQASTLREDGRKALYNRFLRFVDVLLPSGVERRLASPAGPCRPQYVLFKHIWTPWGPGSLPPNSHNNTGQALRHTALLKVRTDTSCSAAPDRRRWARRDGRRRRPTVMWGCRWASPTTTTASAGL